MSADRPALVVAGLSARALAESAARGGWAVISLDVFGDTDTRRASVRWAAIGAPGHVAIDGDRLVLELAAAQRAGAIGWVAGSGFEGATEWLERGAACLPLLGMSAAAVRRLRDPGLFFDTLDALELPHPEVRHTPLPDPAGWLAKHGGGTGGWHIRAAATPVPASDDRYFQREAPGVPMSALFLGDGTSARLVGLNRLIVRRLGVHPYVYRGAIGPVDDAGLAAAVSAALRGLVPAFGLRGLASLDFLADAGRLRLLEINPRPSASMVLHDDAWPGGLVRAHLDAVAGTLPATDPPPRRLRGTEILFARRACRLGADLAAALEGVTDCHDLPAAGAQFARSDPVCSVSAHGATLEGVVQALALRKEGIASRLSPVPEPPR